MNMAQAIVVRGDPDVKPGSDSDRKLNQPEGNENG